MEAAQRVWYRVVAHALWLGLLLGHYAGCVRFTEPLTVRAVGNVTGRVETLPETSPVGPATLPNQRLAPCAIALIDVDGLLLDRNATGLGSRGDNPVSVFRERLDAIQRQPQVKAVVLRIHSTGGSVTATDIMWRDLQAFRQRTNLPVVACLMDVATGGGYYLATGTDLIVAHPTTVTGAIGCVLNLYNLEDLMGQFNIVSVAVKAGDKVDLGSPAKAMEEADRKLLQEMADEFHQRFKTVVLKARPQVKADDANIFDGRVFTAAKARDLGLIDRIGYLDHAVAEARRLAQAPDAPLVFFRRHEDRPVSQYSITPNIPLQDKLLPLNVPGLQRADLPCFLYIWDIEPTAETQQGR